MRDEGHHAHRGDLEQGPKWGLVVNPVPTDRGVTDVIKVALGRRGPISHHAKQDRLSTTCSQTPWQTWWQWQRQNACYLT